jgi:hypothetical protein
MSVEKLFRIKCEFCGRGVTDEFDDEDGARATMAGHGWGESNGVDRCPDCAVKQGEPEAAVCPEGQLRNGLSYYGIAKGKRFQVVCRDGKLFREKSLVQYSDYDHVVHRTGTFSS